MTVELSIVIPVYNEGPNIEKTLRGIDAAVTTEPYEVLIVHDMDEDDTLPVVHRLQPGMPQVRTVRNRERGVLAAMRTGFDQSEAPLVLVSMADGSDDPRDIDRMVELGRRGADVVAASRYMKGGRQVGGPPMNAAMSRGAGLALRWVGGLPIHDATSNFRLYSRRLLDRVTIESTAGFELALELTVKAHRMGMRVAEVPTTWRDRTAGESRFQLKKWLPHYLKWFGVGLTSRLARR